jgi:hypothetical protein
MSRIEPVVTNQPAPGHIMHAEFASDLKLLEFAEICRTWVRRFLIYVVPILLVAIGRGIEPISMGAMVSAVVAIVVLMFLPIPAQLSLSLIIAFYLPLVIGSAVSVPGIVTFAQFNPAILPMYAVCFGGIAFGVVYWIAVAGIYAVFICLHAWDFLIPARAAIFGVPFGSWFTSVLFHGFLYVCSCDLFWK